MKTASFVSVCLVVLAFTGVALAGPTSPLYLTYYGKFTVLQGNGVINSFPMAYAGTETALAVAGDVRTIPYYFNSGTTGGQYSLAGVPTGTTYAFPLGRSQNASDSTSDGTHNYLVNLWTGTVYQTARDFSNATPIFTIGLTGSWYGITYDRTNNSLWLSTDDTGVIADYSMSGVLLSSFTTFHHDNWGLAMDPADHTLWVADGYNSTVLNQYSRTGALLGNVAGHAEGAEFDLGLTTIPEPGSLILFGSGMLGLAGLVRRKINL